MAEARQDPDGPGGDGGEFVVIERLETMKDRQDELEENIRLIRSQLEQQEKKAQQLEKRCAMAENLWKVFWYSLLLTMPATLAFIIDFKLNTSYSDFMSLASVLVGVSIFVGIPSFFFSLYTLDIFEVEEDREEQAVAEEEMSTASEFESEDDSEPEDVGPSSDKDVNNNDIDQPADNELEF